MGYSITPPPRPGSSVDPVEVAFYAGYASAVQTASDLIELNGADVEDWMRASRNLLTQDELFELGHFAVQLLGRRTSGEVAA